MQEGVGPLDTYVMPLLHNHFLGYRHNFALFYQLLHCNCSPPYYLPSREKPLVKPMAPGSIFHHISFQSTILQSFTFRSIHQKNPKICYLLISFLYLSLSDLTFESNREGIDNPFIALGASCLIVCAGIGDLCIVFYWIDTLVLKLREILISTLLHHPFLFKGKINGSSRSSSQQ